MVTTKTDRQEKLFSNRNKSEYSVFCTRHVDFILATHSFAVKPAAG